MLCEDHLSTFILLMPSLRTYQHNRLVFCNLVGKGHMILFLTNVSGSTLFLLDLS